MMLHDSFVFYDLMICLLFIFVDLFYLSLNSSFRGTVGCVLILEGKLEFPSRLALILVSHWIGDGRSSNIYTNSSHIYCYEQLSYSRHACTHAESNRAGFGWRALTTCGHECSSIQGFLNLKIFCFDFIYLNFI